MSLKSKPVIVVVVAFLVFFLIANPAGMAADVRHLVPVLWSGVTSVFTHVEQFVSALMGHGAHG